MYKFNIFGYVQNDALNMNPEIIVIFEFSIFNNVWVTSYGLFICSCILLFYIYHWHLWLWVYYRQQSLVGSKKLHLHILFNWIVVWINHIFVTRSIKAQRISWDLLPYRLCARTFASPFYSFFSILFLFSRGFTSSINGNEFPSFYTSILLYLGSCSFCILEIFKSTKYLDLQDIDLKGEFYIVGIYLLYVYYYYSFY